MTLSNLEIRCIVEELQCLVGKHFEKAQSIGRGGIKLRFRGLDLLVEAPERVHLTDYPYAAEKPSTLVSYLRKRLKGSRVDSVSQHGFDRVIKLGFESGYSIVLEMFAKGNVVAVDPDGNTRAAVRYESWKDREIKPKKPYKYPMGDGLVPNTMEYGEFECIFTKKDVIRSLVGGIKMSGAYLEEACLLAGEDKDAGAPKDPKKLFKAIKGLVGREISAGIQGRPVPFELRGLEEPFVPKKSFSSALDDFYSPEVVSKQVKEPKSARLGRMLAQQEKALVDMGRKVVENKQKGDAIYADFERIKGIVAQAGGMRDDDVPWKEISQRLGIKVNPKTGKALVEL